MEQTLLVSPTQLTVPVATLRSETRPSALPGVRLEVLDAVRGLASICVVLFHIREIVQPITQTLSKPFHLLAYLTEHGHDAVVVFIVLSGFVLTIPVARSSSGEIPGGLWQYLRRRARRILPPYYAALLLFLVLGCVWRLAAAAHGGWGFWATENPFVSPNATSAALLSHTVLVSNFYRPWVMAVDSPMWSVATEWQIYFMFPLILLPCWRRAGIAAAVTMGFAVGMIPVLLLPHGTNFDTWCPWMLGDFALGMAAALFALAPSAMSLPKAVKPWGIACACVVAAIGCTQICLPRFWRALGEWDKDMLTGIAVALLLVYLTRCQTTNERRPILFRLLDTRTMVGVGAFSYSLYLVHLPLLFLLEAIISWLSLSGRAHVLVMYSVGTILSMLAGYGFYLAFERPFTRRPADPGKRPALEPSPAWAAIGGLSGGT